MSALQQLGLLSLRQSLTALHLASLCLEVENMFNTPVSLQTASCKDCRKWEVSILRNCYYSHALQLLLLLLLLPLYYCFSCSSATAPPAPLLLLLLPLYYCSSCHYAVRTMLHVHVCFVFIHDVCCSDVRISLFLSVRLNERNECLVASSWEQLIPVIQWLIFLPFSFLSSTPPAYSNHTLSLLLFFLNAISSKELIKLNHFDPLHCLI